MESRGGKKEKVRGEREERNRCEKVVYSENPWKFQEEEEEEDIYTERKKDRHTDRQVNVRKKIGMKNERKIWNSD